MAFCLSRIFLGHELRRLGSKTMRCLGKEKRNLVTGSASFLPRSNEKVDDLNEAQGVESENNLKLNDLKEAQGVESENSRKPEVNLDMRFKYPEMFPDPFMIFRNALKEKLERKDMIARRSRIYIPEFYVGSVLRVIISNVHQPEKTSSFVGICIMRESCGLWASFTLRNVIDNLGVEIKLHLYDPRIQKIEVLRLEKRLDSHLRYLRDAPPEYSTFPEDMRTEIMRTDEVPINPIKVKLNPRPWTEWWHKYDYKGIENIEEWASDKMKARRQKLLNKPWEKYDLMKTYRETIPEEEIEDILTEIKDDVEKHGRKNRK